MCGQGRACVEKKDRDRNKSKTVKGLRWVRGKPQKAKYELSLVGYMHCWGRILVYRGVLGFCQPDGGFAKTILTCAHTSQVKDSGIIVVDWVGLTSRTFSLE